MSIVLSLLANRSVRMILIAALMCGGAYFKGRQDASDNCQTAALEAKVRILEEAADRARQAQEKASLRAVEREKLNRSLTEQVEAYETDLQEQPDCIISDDDAIRLQSIQ